MTKQLSERRAFNRLAKELKRERKTAQPAPVAQYSDIVSDGGLDPRNKFDVQPAQEPICYASINKPPQRAWVGLTDEEKEDCISATHIHCEWDIVMAVEAKLKEKNG